MLRIVEVVSYGLRFVLAKGPFMRNEIGETSEEVEANFALIDQITFIQKNISDLKRE